MSTPTQSMILTTAIQNHAGQLAWFPENIKGGARQKVIEGLARRDLIAAEGDAWRVTAAGYEALGQTLTTHADAATDTPAPADAKPHRTREDSKQATVIRMLQRPEGATLDQLAEATGWLKHTVRGCLAGALKKKLGITIISAKATEFGHSGVGLAAGAARPDIKLDGQQHRELGEILSRHFSASDLNLLIKDYLDVDLAELAGKVGTGTVSFDFDIDAILKWLEARGLISKFLGVLGDIGSENPDVRDFLQRLRPP